MPIWDYMYVSKTRFTIAQQTFLKSILNYSHDETL